MFQSTSVMLYLILILCLTTTTLAQTVARANTCSASLCKEKCNLRLTALYFRLWTLAWKRILLWGPGLYKLNANQNRQCHECIRPH